MTWEHEGVTIAVTESGSFVATVGEGDAAMNIMAASLQEAHDKVHDALLVLNRKIEPIEAFAFIRFSERGSLVKERYYAGPVVFRGLHAGRGTLLLTVNGEKVSNEINQAFLYPADTEHAAELVSLAERMRASDAERDAIQRRTEELRALSVNSRGDRYLHLRTPEDSIASALKIAAALRGETVTA